MRQSATSTSELPWTAQANTSDASDQDFMIVRARTGREIALVFDAEEARLITLLPELIRFVRRRAARDDKLARSFCTKIDAADGRAQRQVDRCSNRNRNGSH